MAAEKYVDSLKDRIKGFTTRRSPDDKDADRIRANPQYAQVINKLTVLYDKRNALLDQLEKLELDINACLIIISMNEKKEEIDAREKNH